MTHYHRLPKYSRKIKIKKINEFLDKIFYSIKYDMNNIITKLNLDSNLFLYKFSVDYNDSVKFFNDFVVITKFH